MFGDSRKSSRKYLRNSLWKLEDNGCFLPSNYHWNYLKTLGNSITYTASDGLYDVYFIDSTSGEFMKFQVGNSSIAYSLVDSNEVKATVKGGRITYPDIYNNVDLVYITQKDKVKEMLILKEYPNTNEWSFKLNAQNVEWKKDEEGNISDYQNCISLNMSYGKNNDPDANLIALQHFNKNVENTLYDYSLENMPL